MCRCRFLGTRLVSGLFKKKSRRVIYSVNLKEYDVLTILATFGSDKKKRDY